jgi:hypothetical protein
VTFNGKAATVTSNSAMKIKAKVPAGAKAGYIRGTTPGGTTKSATKFRSLDREPPVTISRFVTSPLFSMRPDLFSPDV